jgi:hypothetical protein
VKRALLFVLLLGLGFFLLHVLVQEEQPAPKPAAKQDTKRPRPAEGSGVEVQNGGMNIVTQVSGPLKIAQVRLVPTGNGSRKELVYELSCTNTVPLADGTYRLEGVTVQLFDDGVHAADLTAKQAVVALSEDANGKRSIREDKDLELTGAVVATLPGARIGELRIECGRLRARIAELELALDTPDDQEPVLVQVGGPRAGLLRGRGLRARMPKDRGLANGKLDIVLLREPRLETTGLNAAAEGNLHYVEVLSSGAALLTLEQTVTLGLEGATGLTGARGATKILGDRLICTLQRGKSGEQKRDAILWEQIQLLGAPARVDSPGVALQSQKLTVTPGIDGKPAMLTAHGGPARLTQTDANGTATFTSDAPIRLLQPRSSIAAVYEAMGFPSSALRPLRQLQILVFDGKSNIEAADGFRMQATKGLRVFQPNPTAADGAILAHGLGDVVIEQGVDQERTTAKGNDGFLLTRNAAGDRLVLGSEAADSAHTYRIQRGDFELSGSGACQLTRQPDNSARIVLHSKTADIQGLFGRDLGSADHLEQLEATIANRELAKLQASGPAAHFAFTRTARSGEQIDAFASQVAKTGRASWMLQGTTAAPARIARPASGRDPAGELTAPRIEIHQLGARDVLLDATAQDSTLATFRADRIATANTETTAVITARRIRLLPFALTTSARRAHFQGVPSMIADRMEHVLGRAWVLAEEAVTADLRDAKHGSTRGNGEQLILSQGALAGMWTGDSIGNRAATIENLALDGRRTTATGARVRFFRADGDRIDVLTSFVDGGAMLPPKVVLRDAKSGSSSPLSHLSAQCTGQIEVKPDGVQFRGPVEAQSLLADGSADPAGMNITARTLDMARSLDTGNVTVIDAGGGVNVQWKDLRAQSDKVEIDLRRQRCTATDPAGAQLQLGSRRFQARRIEANYVNYSVRTWFGGFSQGAGQVDSR